MRQETAKTLVWNNGTSPKVADGDIVTIDKGVEGTLILPENATVTIKGEAQNGNNITLCIPKSSKIIWDAKFSCNANPAVTIKGGGDITVAVDSSITGLVGTAICVEDGNVVVLGKVSAKDVAIAIHESSKVAVLDGIVTTSGKHGCTIIVDNYDNVTIIGGEISAKGLDGWAIGEDVDKEGDKEGSVKISGGLIIASNWQPSPIYGDINLIGGILISYRPSEYVEGESGIEFGLEFLPYDAEVSWGVNEHGDRGVNYPGGFFVIDEN